ncbi:unnamed protein product, partial [Allacma fusca]
MQKLKIVMTGDSSTGKTALLRRYCDGKFDQTFASTTVEIEFKIKNIKISRRNIQLIIWDLPGQYRYRAITPNCVRNSRGVVIVYDVTNRSSFDAVNTWFRFVNDYSPECTPVILVGNKSDQVLNREVTTKEGEMKAENFGMYFVETSAKDGQNVADIFRLLVGAALENPDLPIIAGIEIHKKPDTN